MKKRILSVFSAIIISLTLLVSAIPANAFCYNDAIEAQAFELLDLINKKREQLGMKPLQLLEPLADAAQYRAYQYSLNQQNTTSWATVLNYYNIKSAFSGGVGDIGESPVQGPEYDSAQKTFGALYNESTNFQDVNAFNVNANYIGIGRVKRGGTYYWSLFCIVDYEKTNLAAPIPSTRTFIKTGLINPFEVSVEYFNIYGQHGYKMCFSVANEANKTVYFHGVTNTKAVHVEVPEKVVHPTTHKEYTVIGIGDKANNYTQNRHLRNFIRYLVIPKTVSMISREAFYDCDLVSVRVEGPNSPLTVIPRETFAMCQNLLSVGFQCCPNLSSIDYHAFYWCDSLASINFASNATGVMFSNENENVFGSDKINTTVLFMPNHTNAIKDIDLFSVDKASWSSGKLKIYTSKSKVYENFDYLRAQNTTSTLKRVTPNA